MNLEGTLKTSAEETCSAAAQVFTLFFRYLQITMSDIISVSDHTAAARALNITR
jgi:hypothetical protein